MREPVKTDCNKKENNVGANAKTAFMELAAMAGLTKTTPAERLGADTTEKNAPSAPERMTSPQAERPGAVSVIAADAVVVGTTRTEGALDCRGVVKGDLIAKGEITMSGKQTGNIQGQKIRFSNAAIEGNVTAQEHIEITQGTKIIGDVHGGSVVLNGQVTGLICAAGLVCLRKNAILSGDIQAGSLSIEEGAQLSGEIKMNVAEMEPTRIVHI